VVALVVVFSLARGLSSVAAKDVLGKTIPKTRRERVNGFSASLAGVATLGIGGLMVAVGADDQNVTTFAVLLGAAATMWWIASGLSSRIVEAPGETEGGGNALAEAIGKAGLLVEDAPFRRFVMARALLLCSALSAPYYVVLASQHDVGGGGGVEPQSPRGQLIGRRSR
jgi:hypothetical protein